MSRKELFQNLFWPAAAANVFWAFSTLLVNQPAWNAEFLARLLALLLLTLYLTLSWIRVHKITPRYDRACWVFDLFHIWSIVVFALSVQAYRNGLPLGLSAIYIVAMLGHFLGVWVDQEEDEYESANKRFGLAFANIFGLMVLIVHARAGGAEAIWGIPVSIAVVLVLWGLVRWNEVATIIQDIVSAPAGVSEEH